MGGGVLGVFSVIGRCCGFFEHIWCGFFRKIELGEGGFDQPEAGFAFAEDGIRVHLVKFACDLVAAQFDLAGPFVVEAEFCGSLQHSGIPFDGGVFVAQRNVFDLAFVHLLEVGRQVFGDGGGEDLFHEDVGDLVHAKDRSKRPFGDAVPCNGGVVASQSRSCFDDVFENTFVFAAVPRELDGDIRASSSFCQEESGLSEGFKGGALAHNALDLVANHLITERNDDHVAFFSFGVVSEFFVGGGDVRVCVQQEIVFHQVVLQRVQGFQDGGCPLGIEIPLKAPNCGR